MKLLQKSSPMTPQQKQPTPLQKRRVKPSQLHGTQTSPLGQPMLHQLIVVQKTVAH